MTPFMSQLWSTAQPPVSEQSGVEWCEHYLRLPGSARSERYDSSITPWAREPLERATSGECRTVTFVKPVQSGGSVAGEAAICFWLGTESGGDIQYNWEDDEKADDRFDKRFERILKKCKPVMDRAPSTLKHDGYWKKGLILFPHCNFTMQGVFTAKNVSSDTIRFQVNEEIHAWEPGRLAAADGRLTAVWNAVQFNISNAGAKGSQLEAKFLEGTQQHWDVKCPQCGEYHTMRTRWDSKRPELGGLRYDADGCRLPDGEYDYNKLAKTIRYQMPCGYQVRDEPRARRALSLSGQYSEPRNKGASLLNRSYALEAVAVDYISWLGLIQEKHAALRAMRLGDPEPYRRYVTERECRFWDEEERPVVGIVTVNMKIRKNRDGLKDRVVRFGALDKQRGNLSRRGELPHWWGVIRDFDAKGNSLLVFEGKIETDEEAADVMKRHSVKPTCVVVDSGDGASTTEVYAFCLRYGFNAIKGGEQSFFTHDNGSRKIFSPEKPLHSMINAQPKCDDPRDEPLFWLYSKSGIRERLHWLRGGGSVKWEVPGDVSDDYKSHMEAEELEEKKLPSGEIVRKWIQRKRRNDLFVTECYVAMLAEMAGLIGAGAAGKK